jgi:catechol 2,3-dioxygenase-like lactoylglutathione lyase family enzyme
MWVLPVRCGRRAIHHTVVIVRDLDASLRFYRDGLGLDVLADRQVEGDWPGLPGAPSRSLRAVFLGDPNVPDDHSRHGTKFSTRARPICRAIDALLMLQERQPDRRSPLEATPGAQSGSQ